jgi:hypothetical protein
MARFGLILPIVVGLLVAGLVIPAAIRARRRRPPVPELNKHPERLEQMLDPTDDA